MLFTCAHCGKTGNKPAGHINRSLKRGAPVYCNKVCFGLARRTGRSAQQKKAEKRLYDIEYRSRNREMLKHKKRAYFVATYDPVKAAEDRRRRMPRHVEYCRRPEYRAWKSGYDRKYRAKKFYGSFWECFLLTLDIRQEALSKASDYDIRLDNGTLNKRLQRRRQHERANRKKLEAGSLVNLERGQRR